MTTADRPIDAPVCTDCGQYFVARHKDSVYAHLSICRQCNGESPKGEAPWPAAAPAPRKRTRKPKPAASSKVVSIQRTGTSRGV